MEQTLEPAHELGLRDAQLGVRRRVVGERQCDALQLVDELGGQALLELVQRALVDLREAGAGGVDAFNDILMFMCFAKVTALSPTGDCRPFSDQSDGTMLGEGLAMLALKRLDARPIATLSIEAQERHERREKVYRDD